MKASKITRVIGVSDMTRAVQFYRQALGLEVSHTTPYWTDLTCGETEIWRCKATAQTRRLRSTRW